MKLTNMIAEDMKKFMLIKRDNKEDLEIVMYCNFWLAEISILKNKLALAKKERKLDLTIQEEYKIVKKEKEELVVARIEFEKGQREDLVLECSLKADLIDKYISLLEEDMPRQLSEEEISEQIAVVSAMLRGSDTERVFTKRETGLFMKELKVILEGKADMKVVGKLLASVLG